MLEGVEGVEQQVVVSPETAAEAGVNFTPLTAEQLGRLRGNWSAGLGGRFLAVSRGVEALDPEQSVNLPSDEASPNYKVLSDASYAERRIQNKTRETWEAEMKAWIADNKNPFFLKLMGIDLKQGEKLTGDQVNQALDQIKSFFSQDFGQAKIDVFLNKVKEKYQTLDVLKQDFSSFAAFCHVFGEHTGTAVAHLVGAELGITDEGVKQQMGEKINNLDGDEKALLEAIDQLRKEYEGLEQDDKITAIPPGEEEVKAGGNEDIITDLKELQKDTNTVGGYSDVGTDKEHHPNQEDRYGFSADKRKTAAVVADGVTVGGNGDKAAENAVVQIMDKLMKEKSMQEAINTARQTTIEGDAAITTVALGETGALHYANVGDSRIYVYKNNELIQLSVDDEGVDEQGHPGITQSIRNYSDIHFGTDYVPEGGFVLLVVDGVYKRLGDAKMKEIIEENKGKSPAEISKALVEVAKEVGCENATVVTLKR